MAPFGRFDRSEVSAGEHAYLSFKGSRIKMESGRNSAPIRFGSLAGDARKIMPARTFELTH